jgi:hypothetical protein
MAEKPWVETNKDKSEEQILKEMAEAEERFYAAGGKAQQIPYGTSGIKEGARPSPWNRGKKKKAEAEAKKKEAEAKKK